MPVEMSPEDLHLEEIKEASAIPAERKLVLGLELFDRVCEVMKAGIRHESPDADSEEVQRILVQRLELARRLESGS